MPGLGLGLGVNKPKFISGDPPILSDGNTKAWFDMALAYITKDGSNFVSQWSDRSGNDNHLLQAVGTNQPLHKSTGVLFDGVDNFMKCVAFILAQPEQIYIVFKQVSWTNPDRILNGDLENAVFFRQRTTTPSIQVNSGAASGLNGNLAVGAFGIVRILFNGASSELIVNQTAATTGDFGANDMDGFTLGSNGDGTSFYSNIEVKEIIIRNVADTAPNEQTIYDYLESKYSL